MHNRTTDNVMETHRKKWGHELWIVNNDKYCGKILHFRKNTACSVHKHNVKDEVFFLASGKIIVRYCDKEFNGIHHSLKYIDSNRNKDIKETVLRPGESFHVFPGLYHQIYALEDSDLYEFSTHHEENDSIRVSDGFVLSPCQ